MLDDGDLYEPYIDTYLGSDSVEQRNTILAAMYVRGAEQIHDFFDFLLTPDVAAGDIILGLYFLPTVLEDNEVLYDWLEPNFDAYLEKLPDNYEPFLPQVLVGTCTAGNRDLLVDFFEDRDPKYKPSVAKAVETLDACMARKEKHRQALRAYLARTSE